MKNQFKLFLIKTLLFTAPIFVLFEVFFCLGIYPIITNSPVFDKKFVGLQKRHVKHVRIIAVGSSITLGDLESSLLVKNIDTSYYNLGSWSLQLNETCDLTKDWVKRYHPEYVVMCSTMDDFKLHDENGYNDLINTNSYIKDNLPEFFYFKNYHSISELIRRRYHSVIADFDNWGGAREHFHHRVKEWQVWKPEIDGFPRVHTEGNYNALDSLSLYLKHHDIKFIFIQAPTTNSRATEPFYLRLLKSHFDRCESTIKKNGGIYLNYYDPRVFPDTLFYDRIHLLNKGATIFTKMVIKDLKKIIN
jgi:hypothetical protein